jgi:hypothetical protein
LENSGGKPRIVSITSAAFQIAPSAVSVASCTPGTAVAPGLIFGGADNHIPQPVRIAPAINVVEIKTPVDIPKPIATGFQSYPHPLALLPGEERRISTGKVGTKDGCSEGWEDGIELGELGAEEGKELGDEEGDELGDEEGEELGDEEGDELGDEEGEELGSVDGTLEGEWLLGVEDGLSVLG